MTPDERKALEECWSLGKYPGAYRARADIARLLRLVQEQKTALLNLKSQLNSMYSFEEVTEIFENIEKTHRRRVPVTEDNDADQA